ncbi:MAG: thiamine phosphate synthase [Epsilonproteobacteria bacterium]|nr:thiamine phosphate synthase [Campylobacterota bacterium]
MHKVYALFDFALNQKKGLSLESFVEKAIQKGATYLQYRDKYSTLSDKESTLKRLRQLWPHVLIINDELSLVDYCDGVHLGQEDLAQISIDKKEAVESVRAKIGNKIFGLSTHNDAEIREANTLALDYIGLGAYRTTSTKNDAQVLNDEISELAKLSQYPVAAIGGVRSDDEIPNITFLVLGSNIYED